MLKYGVFVSKKVLVIGVAAAAVAAAVWTGGAFYTKSQADEAIAERVAALNEFLKDGKIQFAVVKKDSGLLSDVYDVSIDGCGSSDCRVAETDVAYGFGSVNAKISLSDAFAQKIGGDKASFVKSIFENATLGGNVLTGKMFMRGKVPQGSSAGTSKEKWFRVIWSDAEYDLSWDKQSYKITLQVPELSTDVKFNGKDIKWDFRKIAWDADGSCSDSLVCEYKSDLKAGTLVSGEFVALDGRIFTGFGGLEIGAMNREMCGLQGHISEVYSGGFASCLKKISSEKDDLKVSEAIIQNIVGAKFSQFVEAEAKINGGKAVLSWVATRSDKDGVPTLADFGNYMSLKLDASIDHKFVNGLPYGTGPSVDTFLKMVSGGASDPYKIELSCDSLSDKSSCSLNGRSLGR